MTQMFAHLAIPNEASRSAVRRELERAGFQVKPGSVMAADLTVRYRTETDDAETIDSILAANDPHASRLPVDASPVEDIPGYREK